MNSFSGAMAMSATSIFNNEMCFSLFLFPKSQTDVFLRDGKKAIEILHKNQTHLRRKR